MSGDNSLSCSSSNQDDARDLAGTRPKLLEGIGSVVVSLTCYVYRRSRHLPFLVGPVIGAVEDIVSPCVEPLAVKARNEGLYLLSLADEKLYVLGEIAMEKVPFVSSIVNNAKGVYSMLEEAPTVVSYTYDQVCERGVIGGAANTWVKYEATVKSKSVDTLEFVKRVPLLGTFVPVIYIVGSPLASAISSWLIKHSDAQVKHLVLLDDEKNLEEKAFFVVDHGAEDSSSLKDIPEVDSGDRSLTPESSGDRSLTPESSDSSTHLEIANMSDVCGETVEVKPADDVKGKSTVTIVAPVSNAADDDDSDDELSVLFDAGWSVGKLSPPRKIVVESKATKKGWW